MILKGSELIEKQNILNEIRSNNMTISELRFFSIYLSKINSRDIKTRVVRFPLSDFQKIMDFGRINITQLQNTTNSLLSKVVNIPNEKGGYTGFQLFKECTVSQDNYGEWYVEIDAHDKALPLMFEFKNKYFTYELWNALRLKSSNQLRMYEILKQYQKTGKRELSLSELRGLLGIAPNEYPRWDRFKVRVLDACQQALAETTDLKFTYERGKVGNGGKWLTIIFYIKKNENYIDQLTLEEFIAEQSDVEIEAEVLVDSEEIKQEFKNEKLEFLAEACDNEFSEDEIRVLFDLIVEIIPSGSSNKLDLDRYDYLSKKYHEMILRKPKTNRFGYLKTIIKADIK